MYYFVWLSLRTQAESSQHARLYIVNAQHCCKSNAQYNNTRIFKTIHGVHFNAHLTCTDLAQGFGKPYYIGLH